ncbi:MAG: ATP-binding protein [Pontibacterium sp.]
MSKRNFFKSIESRILAITLLPLLLITLALGGYFISTQIQTAETALYERGSTLTTLLSRAAEFGLLVQDEEQLKKLAGYSREAADITDIVFLDRDYQVVARFDPNGPSVAGYEGFPIISRYQATFVAPVLSSGIDILDVPEQTANEPKQEVVGWVAVVLSKRPTLSLQSEILIEGVLIALTVLVVMLLIAIRFGQRLSAPILELTRVVKQLERGELDTRASSQNSTTEEFATLTRGINQLAENVEKAQQGYAQEISLATHKLRKTLASLEQKNAALDEALKQAAKASSAKDDFLARMSHELRTPLTSVIGFARLLDASALSPSQGEYVRIINQASSLLLAVIDDILDYSKLESNAVTLENIDVDLLALIHDVMDMQAPLAHKKKLELCAVIDPQTPKNIVGDPIRLRQILTNLIGNAIKFTQTGHIVLSVHTRHQDRPELIIRVEDTGIGISQAQVKNLFSAFSQADNSITRRFGGSGLGLAISRRLTELMEGQFVLSSQENQGTQIKLHLPLLTKTVINQPAVFPSNIGQVVIYDPLPLNRRSLRYQLTHLEPKLYSAASLADLLQFVKAHNVSHVIWGLQTRLKDDEFTRMRDRLARFYSGPVIWLHGHEARPEGKANDSYLLKPVRATKLLDTLLPNPLARTKSLTNQHSEHIAEGVKRVLVAEDNSFNQLLIEKILKRFGVLSVTVDNGADAVKRATHEHFDAIIMDVHMPVMDGIEASYQLRHRKPCLPIIALTANVMPEEHTRLSQAGVYQVLTKPIDDNQLRSALVRVLNHDVRQEVSELGDDSVLKRLDISQEQLNEELNRQIAALRQGVMTSDYELIRSHNHQLLGVAGFYELPELEAVGYELREAAQRQNLRQVWASVWRLQRIATHL